MSKALSGNLITVIASLFHSMEATSLQNKQREQKLEQAARHALCTIRARCYNDFPAEYGERGSYSNEEFPGGSERYGRLFTTQTVTRKRFYFFGKLIAYQQEKNLVLVMRVAPYRLEEFTIVVFTDSPKFKHPTVQTVANIFRDQGLTITFRG